jgi:hypothetical protein
MDKRTVPKREQQEIDEINELVSHMYTRYRDSQKKLDEIRGVISRYVFFGYRSIPVMNENALG